MRGRKHEVEYLVGKFLHLEIVLHVPDHVGHSAWHRLGDRFLEPLQPNLHTLFDVHLKTQTKRGSKSIIGWQSYVYNEDILLQRGLDFLKGIYNALKAKV